MCVWIILSYLKKFLLKNIENVCFTRFFSNLAPKQGKVFLNDINLKQLSIMNELIAKIKEMSDALLVDATAQAEKGNKAAGTRARKASLELEKVLKEFRKVSLEESKK